MKSRTLNLEIPPNHTSTLCTKKEINLGRRRLIITSTLLPITLTSYPNHSDAFWNLAIPFAARIFGKPILKRLIKPSRKIIPVKVKKPKGNIPEKNKTTDIINIIGAAADAIDVASLLADTIWKPEEKNRSSLVINNENNNSINTGDISVSLRDRDSAKIDVETYIEPISIPPSSRLVLNMEISGYLKPGIKYMEGFYSENSIIERSGNIIVPKSRDTPKSGGRTIDEYMKEYYSQ